MLCSEHCAQSALNTVFPQERPCYSVSRQETAEGNRSSTEPVGQIIVGGTSERPFTSGYHHADVSSYIDLTGSDGGGVGVVDRGAESNGTMVETTATGSRLTGSSGEGEGGDPTIYTVILHHGNKHLELSLNSTSTVSDVSGHFYF